MKELFRLPPRECRIAVGLGTFLKRVRLTVVHQCWKPLAAGMALRGVLYAGVLLFLGQVPGGGAAHAAVSASAADNPAGATAPVEEIPAWIHPSPYTYDATGKQDPFLPFIRKVTEERLTPVADNEMRPRTPLEQVDVRELRLEGVIWNPENPDSAMAMVELPDGKGFVLRKGMVVGKRQGKITEIAPDRITVQERYVTLFGEEKERRVTLKLYSEDGKK